MRSGRTRAAEALQLSDLHDVVEAIECAALFPGDSTEHSARFSARCAAIHRAFAAVLLKRDPENVSLVE